VVRLRYSSGVLGSVERSSLLFDAARGSLDADDLAGGLALLEQSLAHHVHFKTLELMGEVRSRLGQHREAIIPLAAATGLNTGSRAPCLLAEAFLALGEWADAEAAAVESLRRTPEYGRAKAALERAKRELAAASVRDEG
jgi:predicted Zn-dependent protease